MDLDWVWLDPLVHGSCNNNQTINHHLIMVEKNKNLLLNNIALSQPDIKKKMYKVNRNNGKGNDFF